MLELIKIYIYSFRIVLEKITDKIPSAKRFPLNILSMIIKNIFYNFNDLNIKGI